MRRDDTPFGRAVGEVRGRIPAEPPPAVVACVLPLRQEGLTRPAMVGPLADVPNLDELARWPIAPEVWDGLRPSDAPPAH